MHIWSIFWGCFFVLLGLSIILKGFGINFPFFKIAFGALVIFIGISIIFPGTFKKCCGAMPSGVSSDREVIFGESSVGGTDVSGEYSAVFGSLKIDLTKVELKDKNVDVRINSVFAGAVVMIDASKPVKIKGTAAFGGVMLPNGNTAAFGESVYTSESFKEDKPYINIEASTVFGGIEIKK